MTPPLQENAMQHNLSRKYKFYSHQTEITSWSRQEIQGNRYNLLTKIGNTK